MFNWSKYAYLVVAHINNVITNGRETWYALDLLLVHVIETLQAELQNDSKKASASRSSTSSKPLLILRPLPRQTRYRIALGKRRDEVHVIGQSSDSEATRMVARQSFENATAKK